MGKICKNATAIIVMVVLVLNIGLNFGTIKVKAATTFGPNLVVNGDGELSGPIPGPAGSNDYAGWNSTSIESGRTTAFVVGNNSIFNTSASPNGGNFFDFYPFEESSDTLYQTIDISDISTDVDNGNIVCDLRGYLKKYRADSSATIVLDMLDSSNQVLSSYVLTEDSADNLDIWEYRSRSNIPVNIGTRTFKISLNASISNVGPDNDYIQFDGIALFLSKIAVINVKGSDTNIANGDITPDITDDTNFGSADITTGSITKTFVIESNGATNLLLTGASKVLIAGTNASDFTVTAFPSASVGVGETTTFAITFNPSAVGVRRAKVIIENSSLQDPYEFYIAGTGTETAPVPTPLGQVMNVALSALGVATWDDVTNASKYNVEVFKNGASLGSDIIASGVTILPLIRSHGVGVYTIKVQAIGNGTTYTDGPYSAASESQTIIKLATVNEGLTWNGNVAHWVTVPNAVTYEVLLYKNGGLLNAASVTSANADSGVDFTSSIKDIGGTYTYKVTALGDKVLILDAAQSTASNVNVVATSLAQVTNVALSASGVATWDDVDNEAGYEAQLYKGGVAQGTTVTKPVDKLSHDFLSDMRASGAGIYTVKVTAKGNGSTITDGPQSTASGSRTIIKLATVSGLMLVEGIAHWAAVSNAVSYDVQLYKDGTLINQTNVLASNHYFGADFREAIEAAGNGIYTFKVTAKADLGSLYLDGNQSAGSNNYIKATQLEQVKNVALSTSGVATWDNVESEAGYEVQLYKGGVPQGTAVTKPADTISHDFLSDMRAAGAGIYTVKVTAKGNDSTIIDGPQSNASGSRTIERLGTVTGLTWNGDVARWTTVANAVSYEVQLYKDGTLINQLSVLASDAAIGADFEAAIAAAGTGTYTYKVTAKSEITSLFLDGDLSAVSNDNRKATALVIETTNPPAGTVGEAYLAFRFNATGGEGTKTYAVTSGALPLGLSLTADGTLSGTPTSPGTFNFTVSVADSAAPLTTDSHIFVITINAATYTVTFDSQGGNLVSSVANINSGTKITAPTAPTRTNYTFGGWYKESNCTNAWNFGTDTVVGNVTLYAKWTVNSSNGGGGGYTTPTIPSPTPTTTITPTPTPAPMVSLKITEDDIQVEVDVTPDVIEYYDGQITLPIASEEILNELMKEERSGVRVGVNLPKKSDDADREEINLILESEVIQKAKDNKKNIVVDVNDSNNKVLYSWNFDKTELANSDKDIADVNLSLKVEKASDQAHLLEKQKDDPNSVALVIDYAHEGVLPSQANVRIYVGNQEGITPGTKIYLYHYNEKIGKLETIPYGYQAIVDKDGYITIHILQCSDYVVYTKEADPKLFVSLKKQIKVSPTKISLSLTEGEKSRQIAVKLPVTLEWVSSLDRPTSQSAIGGVTVRFTSSDNQIATVESQGNIRAKSPGVVVIKTTITLYSKKTKIVETRVKINP